METISNKLENLLNKDVDKFSKENGFNLSSVYEALSKKGLLKKSQYSLPLLDTIGQRYHNQIKTASENIID